MERNQLLKVLQITFLMWILCILSVCGQERERIPVDTLWYYFSESDTLRIDSIAQRGDRSSGNVYDVSIPEFQYKSPEAAAFKKYGDYQVNEYTGNPNITVPLYTLSYKDIEIPITLAYDASGIQVEQEASWVGLGWNLMVGGCINYVASGSVDPKSFLASQSDWESFLATGSGNFYNFNTGFSTNLYLKNDIEAGHGERDYFSVNILGKTFLFTFNPFTNAITLIGRDSEKYKVSVSNGSSSYSQLDNAVWKVIDGNGYQYFFSPGELTNAYVIGGAYTSTWNLTQIITPEGSEVNFAYCDTMQVNYRPFRGEQYDILSGYSDLSYYPTPGYSVQTYQSNVSVQTRYLSSVETRDQKINFTLEDRTDMVNAKRLKKISVYSKIAQDTIRKFTFNYDYFTASTVGGNYLNDQATTPSYPPELGLRLKLNSVTETAGATSLTTSFTYNSTQLPLKTSCAKDFWGYFNNCENNGNSTILSPHTLLPTPLPLFISGGIQLADIYRTMKGATRYCNGDYMQAAVLTKITYPTKGYTTFTYEPHRFVSTTRYPTTAEYFANVINVSLTDSNNPNQTTYQQLNLTENTYGMITVTFSGTLSDLKNAGANVTITPMNPNLGSTITYDLSMASDYDIAFGSYFTKSLPIDLQGTSYMMTVNCPNSLGSSGYYVSATLNATQAFTESNVPVSTGGGLRIQSIRNYHHDGTLQYYTNYEYTDGAGSCSGKLLQPLTFSDSWAITCAYQIPGCGDPGCIKTYTYNLHRLRIPSTDVPVFFSSLAGGMVGYSTVRKLTYSANNSLLSTVTTEYNNNLPQYVWNIHYFENDNNGTIKTQTITDSISGTMKRKAFNYSNVTGTNRCNAIVYDRIRDYTDWGYNPEGPNGGRFDVRIYPFFINWNKLDSETDSTFCNGFNQVITKTYTYNDLNHRVMTETSNSSDGTTYTTEYKYPCDYPTEHPCSLMCNSTNFMLYPVIEQSLSATVNGSTSLIKKRKETYTAYNNKYRDAIYNSRVFLPTATSFALNGGSLEQRLTYDYNDKCDRISITKDSEKVTYLWAYNYMYPVAEIRGATYGDLVSWGLSTNISNLATQTTTSDVSSALAAIRSSLASRPVLVTSYTYNPLIGISSMTTPNGTKTTYTYDAMGRLSNVKNHDNDIIQQHSYNYKNN